MIFPMSAPATALPLTDADQLILRALSKSTTAPHREVIKARALLAAAEGVANTVIAQRFNLTPVTIRAWRRNFLANGISSLSTIAPGRGRKPSIADEKFVEIVEKTMNTTPQGQTHWSVRTMATEVGVSPATVQRVWSTLGIKPHLTQTFKVSTDPHFSEKLIDVVGLYLNPPDRAIVLCMDEKSSIQALDRTQATLPMIPGRGKTMTHDYKRNGTTTLFAALDVLTGTVIGQCLPRHRHEEFVAFLHTVDTQVPDELAIHMVLDNYATHKHAEVKAWLDNHPRFHLHFTPTSSSWLNQVERWFRELTDKNLRRGIFPSVPVLIESINEFINAHNNNPKPYVWTATAEQILAKVIFAREKLNRLVNQN